MELTLNISAIVAIIGALTVLTNIIVEVLKRATWEKMPTNLLAIIVAMVLRQAERSARSDQEK